eukprot:GAFH01002419.1.p1 GENE.GAFH01002419.1~~GAFH01002419.1.p1  ORF type:complete len:393 (-),score=80.47 GAFH01002419.1:2-1129(-)
MAAPVPQERVLRPLIFQETIYCMMGTLCITGTRVVEEADAPLHRSDFERAVSLAQHRHEMLSTVSRGKDLVLVPGMQIPFRWIEKSADEGIDAALAEDANEALSTSTAIFRVNVYHYPNGQLDFIIAGAHAFFDGHAIMSLHLELLQYLSTPASDWSHLTTVPQICILDHFPPGYDRTPFPPHPDASELVTLTPPALTPAESPAEGAPPVRQTEAQELTEAETAALLARCKKEGVTPTALLSAIMAIVTAATYAEGKDPAGVPARLRVHGNTTMDWSKFMVGIPSLEAHGGANPTGAHVICASGTNPVVLDVDAASEQTVWDMARTARDTLRTMMARCEGLGVFLNMSQMRAMQEGTLAGPPTPHTSFPTSARLR